MGLAAGAVEAAPTAATTSSAIFPMVAVRAEALGRACEPLLVAGTLLGADHRRLHHPAPGETAPWPNAAGAPPATEPSAHASSTSGATWLAAAEPRYAAEESPGALAGALRVAPVRGGGEDEGQEEGEQEEMGSASSGWRHGPSFVCVGESEEDSWNLGGVDKDWCGGGGYL